MVNNKYWTKRKEEQDKKAQASEDALLRDLSKEYSKASREIEGKISQFYVKYGKNNIIEYNQMIKKLSQSDLKLVYEDYDAFANKYPQYAKLFPVRKKAYQLTRLEGLEIDIKKAMVQLGIEEEAKIREFLKRQYESGYYQTLDDIEKVFNVPNQFNSYNKGVLNQLLKNKWVDGKNFSNRIWDNKGQLTNYLTNEFKTGVARGSSIEKLSKQVQDRFNKSRFVAERLVRTESNYVLNAAEMEAYKDDCIEEYEYLAALDDRTSEICKSLHEKRFKVKDYQPGVNAPPMHAFCRSTTTPVIENDKKSSNNVDKQEKKEYNDSKVFVEAKTVKEAEQYAKDTLGVPNVSYKGVDIVTANKWNEGLKDSFDKFPELKDNFGFVGECHERNRELKLKAKQFYFDKLKVMNPNYPDDVIEKYADKTTNTLMKQLQVSKHTFAQSLSPKIDILTDFRGVTVNRDWGKDSIKFAEALKNDVTSKFHPVGCDTIRSVLDHEIGHQLDDLLGLQKMPEIKNLFDSRLSSEMTEQLSTYAWDNRNKNRYSEMIAEGWAEYSNNPKPREIAKTIGEVIEREYTKKYGGK